MKAQLSDFVPGRVLYHVYGVNRKNTVVDESEINKLIITSHPYEVELCGSQKYLFVKLINCYIDCSGKESSYKTESSLNDMGVDTGNKRSVYNLNRAYTSKEAAMKFLAELKADKFSDPVDQKYAEGFTPEDQERERQEWRETEMYYDY
ncbi:hypothetical protein [Kosakonia phage Kc304]|nr:hypothetical protein [Kosakonia phage Kc304]